MTDRVWHKGPPPHVGWWNARVIAARAPDCWGWWNGKYWSCFASSRDSARFAAIQGSERGGGKVCDIEWTDYYPENARVPRIAP